MVPQGKVNELWKNYQLYVEKFYDLLKLHYEFREYDFKKNLEQKTRLCEAAEKLAEEPDVISAIHQLQKLHQEFRAIGPVAKKHSDAVWKRFIGACDYFFERKNKATSSQRSEEVENLAKKEDVIKRMAALEAAGTADDATAEQVRALMKEWNAIGFVPFKEKDRLYKEFHALVDKLFDRLHLSATEKRLSSVRTNGNK